MLDTWEKMETIFRIKENPSGLKMVVCSGECLPPPNQAFNVTLLSAVHGLPDLSYPKQRFHLALCSDFLFWFTDLLSEDFHVASLLSFCRAATEVQVYPLMDRFGNPSIHLGNVLQRLQANGIGVEIKAIPTPIIPQNNALLRLWTETCTVKPKKQS